MKVIVSDLRNTGARWIFLGDKFLVDAHYLEDFVKEHPETKTEDISIGSKTEFN